jgi:hypothetical protein
MTGVEGDESWEFDPETDGFCFFVCCLRNSIHYERVYTLTAHTGSHHRSPFFGDVYGFDLKGQGKGVKSQIVKQMRFIGAHTVKVPATHAISFTEANEIADELRRNVKWKVTETCLALESIMARTLAVYFFGTNKQMAETFQVLVLESDWCGFASKLRLLMNVIEREDYVPKKEREKLEQLIRDSITYRNMFTHGSVTIKDGIPSLLYFKTKPREEVLDDFFLTKVESALFEAYAECEKLFALINSKRGSTPPTAQPSPLP